jgi:hypothetical protein
VIDHASTIPSIAFIKDLLTQVLCLTDLLSLHPAHNHHNGLNIQGYAHSIPSSHSPSHYHSIVSPSNMRIRFLHHIHHRTIITAGVSSRAHSRCRESSRSLKFRTSSVSSGRRSLSVSSQAQCLPDRFIVFIIIPLSQGVVHLAITHKYSSISLESMHG